MLPEGCFVIYLLLLQSTFNKTRNAFVMYVCRSDCMYVYPNDSPCTPLSQGDDFWGAATSPWYLRQGQR